MGVTRSEADEEPGFVCLWSYRVRPKRLQRFEEVYGANGEWTLLFRRTSGYLGTRLYRDLDEPTRYLTMDAWRTRADFDAFRRHHGAEYEQLDQRSAALTLEEDRLGCFEGLAD
jgi:heme-degrading monooxygenase HmoA